MIVPVKNNMQVSSQGYYHFYAFVVNSGSNTCGVDLEYAHFPRGTNPDQPGTTDGASEVRMRSFLITADAWGLVDSGPVGYCSPGDGGYLQLNTWPDPDLDLRLIWPDGTEYYAVAMNFPCE